MNGLNRNLMEQVVVFSAEVMQAAYRALPYRVWKVTGGYGASPMAQGRTLFCRSLLTGEEAQFDGMAVERIARDEDVRAVQLAKASK